MLLTILFYFFVLTTLIQVIYWVVIFGKFAFAEEQSSEKKAINVSIIIAAKNEADNLKQFLPEILNQDYPDFEVILINDASTDNTLQIIKEFQKDNLDLKLVNLEISSIYQGNKKNAITKGIEASTNKYLLFTDADCCPVSKNWITEMVNHLNDKKQLILGYGAYKKLPSFINKLIRYETLLTAIQYFSHAKIGLPYMGVGRNLSYKKELFYQSNGFEPHKHIKSGDDDLFINEIATSNNTTICFSKDSFTVSEPKKTYSGWFRQKRRHISTANYYKPIHKFLLGLFYFSQLSFWVLAIILLLFSFNWQLVTILVAIRLISQYIAIYNSALKLNEKDLIFLSPILDIVLVFSQLGLFFSNLLKKPNHW